MGRWWRGERGKGIEGVAVTDSFVFGSTVSICDGRGEREEGRGGERGGFAPHSHSEDRIGERSGADIESSSNIKPPSFDPFTW